MRTLLVKDLRQTFWPALMAVLLLFAPVVAWLGGVMADGWRPVDLSDASFKVGGWFLAGAVASLIASSSITGVAFARERRERTADLIGTLPVARWTTVTSKALAALIVVAAPVLVGLGVFIVVAITRGGVVDMDKPVQPDVMAVFGMIFAMWLTLFGLGWALSSILRSEVLSAAVPIFFVLVVTAGVATWGWPKYGTVPAQSEQTIVFTRLMWIFGVTGVLGLVVGTVVAMKRRSP